MGISLKKVIKETLKEIDYENLNLKQNNIKKPNFMEKINLNFEDIVPKNLSEYDKRKLILNLERIFFEIIDEKQCGIVIVGIDKKTMKGSYCQFEMILNTENEVLIKDIDYEIDITGSKIKIFAQNEVINSFLNGIDEDLQNELSNDITYYIENTLEILIKNIKEKNVLDSNELKKVKSEIEGRISWEE